VGSVCMYMSYLHSARKLNLSSHVTGLLSRLDSGRVTPLTAIKKCMVV